MGLSGRLRSLLDTASVDSPELQKLPITKQSLLRKKKKCVACIEPMVAIGLFQRSSFSKDAL